MKTQLGTLDMTPTPVGKKARRVWVRPIALLVGGIALAVFLNWSLH